MIMGSGLHLFFVGSGGIHEFQKSLKGIITNISLGFKNLTKAALPVKNGKKTGDSKTLRIGCLSA